MILEEELIKPRCNGSSVRFENRDSRFDDIPCFLTEHLQASYM